MRKYQPVNLVLILRLVALPVAVVASLAALHAQDNTSIAYSFTTLAGVSPSGSGNNIEGMGDAARFYSPKSVAAGSLGNIYVAGTYNNAIRKITPAGVVTTSAGAYDTPDWADGTGGGAFLNLPLGVAVDGSGNIYVADTANNTIRKITLAGVVTTFAGTADSPDLVWQNTSLASATSR